MAEVQSQPQSMESQYLIPNSINPVPLTSRNHSSSEQNQSTPSWTPPPSGWTSLCHPRVDEVSHEVDDYFLRHWNFPTAEARKVFVKAGFSRVTCLYFPLAKDDRIHFASRLLTVLFLIDDALEDMSLAEGEAYNAKLIPISRGDVLPNRDNPVEYITYDLWESMRAHDKELADAVLEPTFTFMQAQTDRTRMSMTELGQYLEYREKDVGKALLSALMRFSMSLSMTPKDLTGMTALERNCSKHISIINDIYSWEKELRASQTGDEEGSVLCTAVKILADGTCLSIEGSKRILYAMAREWEDTHNEMVTKKVSEGCSQASKAYMKGLEYQMSGNELWSRTTPRYHKLES